MSKKLPKCYKKECKMLSKTMLYATVLGKKGKCGFPEMEFDLSFIPGHSDLWITLIAGDTFLTVGFHNGDELVETCSLFTFKQLSKLGSEGRYCMCFDFDNDEVEDKLYQMLKYLYKNG